MTASERRLTISEAVLLAHTMVQGISNSLGIRLFFIKGPASMLQGLREPRISADVDVLVDPLALEHLLRALRLRGWRQRPAAPDSTAFPKHAITLDHPFWPCCIDVHFRFPGMENDSVECFEVLWAQVQWQLVAGQQVRVPSKAAGILVLALHALRSPWLPASVLELSFLSRIARCQPTYVEEIVEIAKKTGSCAALRPFLEGLIPASEVDDWPEPSQAWRNRVKARRPGSAGIIAILQARWNDKPKEFWRAVFPKSEVFLSKNIYADMSLAGRLGQHRARWGRFMCSLPHIAKDLGPFSSLDAYLGARRLDR